MCAALKVGGETRENLKPKRPKGGCLQDIPVITDVPIQSAKLWQTTELPCTIMGKPRRLRTIQMEPETSTEHSDGNRNHQWTIQMEPWNPNV